MTTKSFAIELRDLVRSIRDEQGVSEIKCDTLIAYLEEVINSSGEEITSGQMERYKAELQVWVKENEAIQTQNVEMFRAVILAGQNALRTAFLMNGGATVAILAFLGKLSDQQKNCGFLVGLGHLRSWRTCHHGCIWRHLSKPMVLRSFSTMEKKGRTRI